MLQPLYSLKIKNAFDVQCHKEKVLQYSKNRCGPTTNILSGDKLVSYNAHKRAKNSLNGRKKWNYGTYSLIYIQAIKMLNS